MSYTACGHLGVLVGLYIVIVTNGYTQVRDKLLNFS